MGSQNKQDGIIFATKFWLPCQKTWVLFYKTYRKTYLTLSKKRNISVYYILCSSSWWRDLFKESPAFLGAHNCIEKTYYAIKQKDLNKSFLSKEVSGQVYQIQKLIGSISLRSWGYLRLIKWLRYSWKL